MLCKIIFAPPFSIQEIWHSTQNPLRVAKNKFCTQEYSIVQCKPMLYTEEWVQNNRLHQSGNLSELLTAVCQFYTLSWQEATHCSLQCTTLYNAGNLLYCKTDVKQCQHYYITFRQRGTKSVYVLYSSKRIRGEGGLGRVAQAIIAPVRMATNTLGMSSQVNCRAQI